MRKAINQLTPGLSLCGLITLSSYYLEYLEIYLFERVWLETLVMAILLGSAVRTFYRPNSRFDTGIHFGAKTLLEIAVVLLGASVSASAIMAQGASLIGGIALVVVIAIIASYSIGRLARLPKKMAILIACGNSICGNSAIAAVAPIIDADGNDVASSIAFTAVLGIAVVLILPIMIPLLNLTVLQYGVFAGLTVYAVPQVLAATTSVSLISAHIGTLVKLVRVLMLGPVVLTLSMLNSRNSGKRLTLSHMAPWFIVGFLSLITMRSFNLIPQFFIEPAHIFSNLLTVMSMAALGLGVDVRSVARAGYRVTAVVVLSFVTLFVISFVLIKLLGLN
ncbi:YeiH family protein [Polynucleobacter sp. Fuers-14]|uniref:YeiH family protein n=1 Tax=Polynucleobacter sp. Fuers-14 TaxID=1758364 RepID=UPI001C0CEEAD|nr:YeiH family protein [Polynucleobacter sp. Fuers-14]MBU3641866.1 YeiH family putative sulfate export transporter [Polynucleobacter sp. Fuers-14]